MNIRSVALLTLLSPIVLPYAASQITARTLAASAPAPVPPLIPYSGQIAGRTGQTSATFLIFKDQTGGEPLFTESQMIALDEAGRYKVQLGEASPSGLPSDLFATGEARWLEVQIAGQPAEPRVLLASVPYALKAADAATLGGLPASAFVLAGSNVAVANATPAAITPDAATTVTTTGGSANQIAKFSGSNTIVNSTLYDNGTEVGIGTTSPTATLTVNGGFTVSGITNLNNYFDLNPAGTATASASYNSQAFKFFASAYNSSSKTAVEPHFEWLVEPSGNNTAAPNGSLHFLASPNSNSATETGLYLNTNGILNFASGQTFPGTGTGNGTITGVTAGTGLTGGGTSGAVTLNLNTGLIPTLAGANTFTNSNVFVPSIYEDTDVNIDNTNANNGSNSPGLRFGSASGEGVASKRTSGGNQYGLDFYTDYAARFQISEAGTVGINAIPQPNIWLRVYTGGSGYAGFFVNDDPDVPTISAENLTTGGVADVFDAGGGTGLCNIDTDGDLDCDGTISGASKSFKIDHPLDPANKYLVHASVESSEMMNIYSGNVTTDELGIATVTLPGWFEAENGDFRYQLTTIGRDAHAWVSQEVSNGKFQIGTNATNVKVSWQITAVRQDSYAKSHPLVAEQDKPAKERGLYRNPEAFGQSKEKGIAWSHRTAQTGTSKAQPGTAKLAAVSTSAANTVNATP